MKIFFKTKKKKSKVKMCWALGSHLESKNNRNFKQGFYAKLKKEKKKEIKSARLSVRIKKNAFPKVEEGFRKI